MQRGLGAGRAPSSFSLPCAVFKISIQLKEVTCLKKEKTAKLIPNAIQICTESEKVSGGGPMWGGHTRITAETPSNLPRHSHQSRAPFVLNLACLLSCPSRWSSSTHFGWDPYSILLCSGPSHKCLAMILKFPVNPPVQISKLG